MKILITGGHSGIGLELSKLLLADGHHLGLVVRNEKRADGVAGQLGAGNVEFFFADLSNQSEVMALAGEVRERWGHFDGLFNNAGVLLDDTYYSPEENEMHLEVNVLAPYILVNQLSDLLTNGFIVNTSTGGLHKQKALKLDTMLSPGKFVKLMGAYYHSKLAMTLLMRDVASTHKDMRILNVDPGALKTKMTEDKDAIPFFLKPFVKLVFKPPVEGAKKLYEAAFSAKFVGKSGVYVTGNAVKSLPLILTQEEKDQLLAGIKQPLEQDLDSV